MLISGEEGLRKERTNEENTALLIVNDDLKYNIQVSEED